MEMRYKNNGSESNHEETPPHGAPDEKSEISNWHMGLFKHRYTDLLQLGLLIDKCLLYLMKHNDK